MLLCMAQWLVPQQKPQAADPGPPAIKADLNQSNSVQVPVTSPLCSVIGLILLLQAKSSTQCREKSMLHQRALQRVQKVTA